MRRPMVRRPVAPPTGGYEAPAGEPAPCSMPCLAATDAPNGARTRSLQMAALAVQSRYRRPVLFAPGAALRHDESPRLRPCMASYGGTGAMNRQGSAGL